MNWADSSRRGGRDKVHKAVDDLVKAIMFNGRGIRGRSCPKGHGRPKKGLEGSGERELINRAKNNVAVTSINAMSGDKLGNVGGSRGGGTRGQLLEREIREGLERLPSDLSSSLARAAHDIVQVVNGASAQETAVEVVKTSPRGRWRVIRYSV